MLSRPSYDDVTAAAQRIAPHVLRTPLLPSEAFSQETETKVYLKAESLQPTGAFKVRGASNAVMALGDADAERGILTHSSGNHAAAVARAARLRGVPAHIVMPENSSRVKIEAVRALGVEPTFCEPTAESRVATAEAIREQTGATLVPPYNHPDVIAGQGTVGLEILEQQPDVDVILVPVGGGGLLSGILTAVKAKRPSVQVIAAEPALADDAARSLASGSIQQPTRYDTIADGLRTPLGTLTFPIIQDLLDDIELVDEDAIARAQRDIEASARLVVEPSGAIGLAALRQLADRLQGQTVAVVLTGGNYDRTSP